RGTRALSAANHARRPPCRDRGAWHDARAGACARGRSGAGRVRGRGAGCGSFRRRRGQRRSRSRRLAAPADQPSCKRPAHPQDRLCVAMAYFVTGATGFIGRRLVERLLDKRPGKVYVLVRESSRGRLDDLITHWGLAIGSTAAKRVEPVHGDLRGPLLGLEQEQVAELRGKVVHFFHLAAVYDMTAPAELNTAINVGGTAHAVELARALEVDHLHHVSSIAVAGEYRGLFEEGFFDERQKLPSPYHRTKFEAERIVREQPYVAWRVYRPAIVVGDSQTGEMDKIDGPYYFFKA